MSIQSALATLQPKIARALNVRAELLREDIYGLLEESKSGSGVFYPGNKRQSSAPGEPPARQTGKLQESIAVIDRATPRELRSTVGPRAQSFQGIAYYPVMLEFGTRRGLEERPFMRPAVERYKRSFPGRVR